MIVSAVSNAIFEGLPRIRGRLRVIAVSMALIGKLAPIARLANGAFAPLWTPALLVYLLLSLGTAVFVVPRASSALAALAFGAIFGLVSFGVYDLTNYATLAAWPRVVVLVDMAWGAFACGVAAAVTYTVVR